jgi:hypothetical protein
MQRNPIPETQFDRATTNKKREPREMIKYHNDYCAVAFNLTDTHLQKDGFEKQRMRL